MDRERKGTRGKAPKSQRQAAELLLFGPPNINSGRGLNMSFHLENKIHRPLKEEEKIHAPYKVSLAKSDPQPKKYKMCEETEKCNLPSREKVISSSQ